MSYVLPSTEKKSMQQCENGKSGWTGGWAGVAGLEGADLVQGVQWALVVVMSCFMPGQKSDCVALDSMVLDPEWAACRCSSTSSRREAGMRGY